MIRRIFLDVESFYSATVSLKKMLLRQYLAKSHITGFAAGEDDEEMQWYHPALPGWDAVCAYLREAAEDDNTVFVAHNAAFDIRALRYWINLPQPKHVHCTLEMCCAAYPNQPGGYKLKTLASTLNLGAAKIDINLNEGRHTPEELAAYCIRDAELCRNLYFKCLPRIHQNEMLIGEMCNRVRELCWSVDEDKVAAAYQSMSDLAAVEAACAIKELGEGGADGFGSDNGIIRSVKPHTIKRLLLENLGFEAQSISLKKLNPEKLHENPQAAKGLKAAAETNKALSHKRRVAVFRGAGTVDLELGWARAHTFRFSSPAVGRGLNGHNLPKRNKVLARAIRSMFRLENGRVIVRADLMNVEYRMNLWLIGAELFQQFIDDPLCDPYANFWKAGTGQICSKILNVAARQLAKAAVLGLGFLMGLTRWMEELAKGLADPSFKVTLADLQAVCEANGWGPPTDRYAKAAMTKARVCWQIAAVAYHTHRAFHQVHPEIGRVARWMESAVQFAVGSSDGGAALDEAYRWPNAPSRERIDFQWAADSFGPGTKSIRVRCGLWPSPTVTWRDLCMRESAFGWALHSMHATKGYRPLSKNVLIENCVQSAARNAMCAAQLQLLQEFPYEYTVHDELMLLVPETRDDVLAARDALVRTLGPGNSLGYGPAIVVDPSEINASRTLYEVDLGSAWWDRLRAGDLTTFKELP